MEDTEKTPELSVIIPVRNGERNLADQLAALGQQSLDTPWEVVVVDNGSTDATVSVARAHGAIVPCLRVVDASAEPGQAYALNAGASAAQGRSLLLLDADDIVGPGYLAAMAAALREHEFVAARLDCDRLNPSWLRASRPPTQITGVGSPLGFLPSAAGCSLGIQKSAFDAVEGFDPCIMEGNDIDFCWRVQLNGLQLEFVPDAVVFYRYRDTLPGIFSQARGYGSAGPTLYKRYRERGMPKRSWRSVLRFYGGPVLRVLKSRSKSDLSALVFLAGFRFGILEGCLRNRVLYL